MERLKLNHEPTHKTGDEIKAYKLREFAKELSGLINKFSLEGDSNTPDFMLAEYLTNALVSYNEMIQKRNTWYGKIGNNGQRGTLHVGAVPGDPPKDMEETSASTRTGNKPTDREET